MNHFLHNCASTQDDLKAYADGELSWLRRQAVRRHLTHCASCQQEITKMTQLTDDLRASEPADPLPPALREKLLAPGTGLAGLLLNGSRSATPESLVPEALSLDSSPALPVPGTRRKRRLPAWGFAAVALVAWFVFYPMFRPVRENARLVSTTASTASTNKERRIAASIPAENNPIPPENATGNFAPSVSDRAVPMAAMPPKVPPLVRPAPMVASGGGVPLVLNRASNQNSLSAGGDPDSLRQVHKEASIGVQVANPETTGDTINAMVQETGGYVAANNLTTGDDGLKTGELIVKVPETQFETFLAQVAKLGIVESKNISGQDITEKTSDANEAQSVQESDLEQSEARLKALGSKAKWEDQENTRDLRIQLAQTRARLKLLKRMAELGTITIDLSQTPKAVIAPAVTNGFTGTLKATTHDALQSLVGSASALLALVIWLLAYSPFWVPLLFLGRYVLKEYRRREAV